MHQFSDLITDFLFSKEIEDGCSKSTIRAYHYDLKKFITISGDLDINDPELIIKVRDFLRNLYDLGYQKKSVARKIATLRSFFKFLYINEYIMKNPMLKIKSPKIKIEESLPKFLEINEIEEILHQIINTQIFNTKISYRYYLEVRLLYSTMARVSELCNIKIKDVDFNKGYIRLRGKGNKERIVPIDNNTVNVIKKELENRIIHDQEDFLILNSNKRQIRPRTIQADFMNIKEKLGIPKTTKFTPHILRHSGATHLRRAGMDISELQDILGHRSPTTTMIYAKNDITKIKESYSKMHPLNNN